jgi:hypothetical protein
VQDRANEHVQVPRGERRAMGTENETAGDDLGLVWVYVGSGFSAEVPLARGQKTRQREGVKGLGCRV